MGVARIAAAAVAVAWAIAGWRNLPRLEHPSPLAAGLAIAGTCGICYFLGRSVTRNAAFASARAHAEARAAAIAQSRANAESNVNVFVAQTGGAAVVAREQFSGLDGASWIGAPVAAAEQDVVAQMIEDGQIEHETA